MPLYRGWSIVLACGIIASFSWGLGFYGLGVYLHALNRLHGWSAGLISVAVTVYYTLSAGGIVVVGNLIDRHGPRGVLTYGVVTMAAAVAALGVITAPWQLFAVYLVMATSWACLSLTGISSTLLPWFGRRQGLAMTLALTGASVGGMVLVPILVMLIQPGWRGHPGCGCTRPRPHGPVAGCARELPACFGMLGGLGGRCSVRCALQTEEASHRLASALTAPGDGFLLGAR